MRSFAAVHGRQLRTFGATVAVYALLVGTVGVGGALAVDEDPGLSAVVAPQSLKTDRVSAPTVRKTVRPTAKPPTITEEQRRELEEEMNENEESPEWTRSSLYGGSQPRAAGLPQASPERPAADSSTFTYFQSVLIPFAAGSQRSSTDEPSVDGSGRMRFVTGNWYAARSTDGGSTWTWVNPFANFGTGHTGFCCDQVVAFDAGRNRFFWLRQYTDGHLELSNSSDLVSWCTVDITRSLFGLPAGTKFDYDRIALSTDNVYISTNVYPGADALVIRTNIDAFIACNGVNLGRLGPRNTEFSVSFVDGAGDTMYWGTNWATGGSVGALGTGFRILMWPDQSNSVTVYDRAITAYTHMTVGTGDCRSANGTVLNWCQRADSRLSGNGTISFPSLESSATDSPPTQAILSWAFNAKQDGSHPFPYVRRVYFRVSDTAYLGRHELWGNTVAYEYPAMAVNRRGHVAMIAAWGGGTGTNAYYPGWGVLLDDDVSTPGWTWSFTVFGAGNTCLSDGQRRWGDYLGIEGFKPDDVSFIAVGYRFKSPPSSTCSSGVSNSLVEVRQIVFGRGRDQASYNRWFNK